MKLLIASDIHGSAETCSKMLKRFDDIQADQLILLGDLLYHGPRNDLPQGYDPKKTATMLNEYKDKIIAIRGNCDGEVDQMVLDFPITSDYNVFLMNGYRIFASHGHVYSPEHLPALKEGDCFLFGHIHIPTIRQENGITILNPGSITLPKGGKPATYAVLENDVFTIYTMEHEIFNQVHLSKER